MSVSKWRYTEECNGRPCPGDCDYCSFEPADLISRADAIEAVKDTILKRFNLADWYEEMLNCGVEIEDRIKALPSADAVDCTDFIEWLVDRVLDETIWEYNSVAYGEIICRKLEKLGILETTEEPSYYIRPSADAVDVYKAHEEEHLNIINRIKELQYAIAKTQTIVGEMVESADAVQGEWTYLSGSKGSYMTISCPICGSTFNDVAEWKYNYCPNCGARMKGGDDE